MTISGTENKVVYAGNNIATQFFYTFRVDNDSDMQVFLGEDLQSTDYIVNRNPDNMGGDVTFSAAPVLDEIVTLLRVVPETQGVDYQPYDAFPAETHEDALDKLTMIAQQHAEELGRVPKEPIGIPPEPEPGYAHNLTSNRDAADCHPISAVTNLQTALDALQAEIDINVGRIADNADAIVTNEIYIDANTQAIAAIPDGIGVGQTWQLPVRALDTTYTNSTGAPIQAVVTRQTHSGGVAKTSTFLIDGVLIADNRSAGIPEIDIRITGSFIVPDGSTYRAEGTAGINTWAELR